MRIGGMNNGMPGTQFAEFAQPGQNAQQKNIEVYAQSLAQQHRVAMNNNTASPQGMNSGTHGSPMAQPGLDGQHEIFAGNGPRPGMAPNAPGAPQGNHALQDYQMQLMLLEQQNKKRLLMARQEQDNMSGPQHQGGVAQGFPAAMSPQGNRPGPSPNPQDQMKRGTPKMGQMPGSPLPEGAMQQQRGSPAPNMQQFDPNLVQPGMPPQFYAQMPHQSPSMMRPPSSHPGANFNGQQMTPQQQMEAMRNGQMQQNGAWRGGPQQPGMMPGPVGGPMGNNPQQRQQMPPPPAPANDQPRPEPSPSVSNQAPPTPSSTNKPAPKKKGTKDNVKVKLRDSLIRLSFVDIDCRSPQTRKGQMQVQLQWLQVVKNRPRRQRLRRSRPSRRIRNNHSTSKMVNLSKCNSSRRNHHNKTICLLLAT